MHSAGKIAASTASVIVLLGARPGVAQVPPMPALKTFHTQVRLASGGQPESFIAIPPGPGYRLIARRVAKAVAEAAGAALPVRSAAAVSVAEMTQTNMVLLGHFADNPLVNRLYDLHYVTLDTQWPDQRGGGSVVRTVHDPFGKGTSFVYLGGTTAEAVGRAADAFIAMLPREQTLDVPHTISVMLADRPLRPKRDPQEVVRRVDAARSWNFRALATAVTRAATNYYLSGNPDELEVFRQTVPLLRNTVRKVEKVRDARGAFDLLNMWDAVEEAPWLSDRDRREISEFLWEFANKFRDANTVEKEMPTPVGNDWDSRVSWDIARYFMKYYGVDVAGLWTWANTRFSNKANFWRSSEDCPGYGGMTMYDMLYYALPAGYDAYFESGMARRMADYGVAVMNNLGGHAGFGDTSSMGAIGYWANLFLACAWKYRDGRYIYAYHRTPGLNRSYFGHNTYLQDTIQPVLPTDMLGIHVVPLPDWVYDHREKVLGTAPSAMDTVLDADPAPPREHCFDKITFRNSFDPQDQYLILGGVSHGYHAHPDGNAIIEFTDNGRYCLFDSGYFVPDTVEHNTLVVYRDGLFEPTPRLTGLSAMADFRDVGLTQTYQNGFNGVDWRRNIVWRKEAFFVVVDEIEARQEGNFALSTVYRTLSDSPPVVDGRRVVAVHRQRAFNLVSAVSCRFTTAQTTPPNSERHALVESLSAKLRPGQKRYFVNLMYAPDKPGTWPYDAVSAGAGVTMVKTPTGFALAGPGADVGSASTDAAVFYADENGFALAAGRFFRTTVPWLEADKPVDAVVLLGTPATAVIEAEVSTVVRLAAGAGTMTVDGERTSARRFPGGQAVNLPPGRHTVSFSAPATRVDLGTPWATLYARLLEHENNTADTRTTEDDAGRTLEAAWRVPAFRTETHRAYVDAQGKEVADLTRTGRAKCWTDAQRGANAGRAVDDDPASYCAVSSGIAWTGDLPKDLGMEWDNPARPSCFEIDYYDAGYAPADDGHELQAWTGDKWVTVSAEVSRDETGAKWTYIFDPIETTRLRVFITKFSVGRTAVREMRVFPRHARPQERQVRVPLPTASLAAEDLDGDGKLEILAAVGNVVRCIAGTGDLKWERTLPGPALSIDTFDLDRDGKSEVAVGAGDKKLYCLDHEGQLRWSVLTPADPYAAEVEPQSGAIRIVKCADLDGDGDGEIIIGSSNWFAYAYDHAGAKLWGALNWAHQPTSIAFPKLPDGTLGALIGTTYCDANLFDSHGGKIRSATVGYHGAAMSVAAGDMDGNGKDELLVGSRVGGVHCYEVDSDKTWVRFMGAEVTDVEVADLTGDGRLELVAASRNAHVLVTDSAGTVLWSRDVGDPLLDLAVADVTGDGVPDVVICNEGGLVRVLDTNGRGISTFTAPKRITAITVGDFSGDGAQQIAAASDDGHVYCLR